MKQHITLKQLEELSVKTKEKLNAWWKPVLGDYYVDDGYIRIIPDDEGRASRRQWATYYPLLSIGQMIEFLVPVTESPITILLWEKLARFEDIQKPELCDVLWEAVKEILNKE